MDIQWEIGKNKFMKKIKMIIIKIITTITGMSIDQNQ
jgi:hypothetical protein